MSGRQNMTAGNDRAQTSPNGLLWNILSRNGFHISFYPKFVGDTLMANYKYEKINPDHDLLFFVVGNNGPDLF